VRQCWTARTEKPLEERLCLGQKNIVQKLDLFFRMEILVGQGHNPITLSFQMYSGCR
jgi:hypothetical protein